MTLQKKKENLDKIKQLLILQENKQKRLTKNLSRLERKKQFKKLLIAGRLFERAGILNNYDAKLVLGLLHSVKDLRTDNPLYFTFKNIGENLLNKEKKENGGQTGSE